MIQIENVSKIFQTKQGEVRAVDDVSLTIQDGEIYGIIGFSGAGKSTFIRLLNGLETVTAGKIVVNAQEITALKHKELLTARKKIAMIFQHFNLLWSRTVEDNIAFSLEVAGVAKQERRKRVAELVELVGLTGREKSYPAQLSGGQKQRVGIARALANNPEVLLCDEATSALDPKTTDDILELLVSINRRLGLTIVMITHEMHVVSKICHKVAVMEDGKIVESGEVSEVFRHPQQEITKQFVGEERHDMNVEEILAHLSGTIERGLVARVQYFGELTGQGTLANVARKFDVNVSILSGNINLTQNGPIGTMVIVIEEEPDRCEHVLKAIEENGVQVEVIQYVDNKVH